MYLIFQRKNPLIKHLYVNTNMESSIVNFITLKVNKYFENNVLKTSWKHVKNNVSIHLFSMQ